MLAQFCTFIFKYRYAFDRFSFARCSFLIDLQKMSKDIAARLMLVLQHLR